MKKIYFLFVLYCLTALSTIQAQKVRSAVSPRIAKPVVLAPTHVTPQGFTANWQPVEGAEAYCVFVYTEHTATGPETFTVVEEDFDRIDFGSVDNPVWSDELYENLDRFTSLPNWSVYGYTSYAQGMVGGVVYSPYMDLRNNGGKYQVALSVYGVSGDEIFVHAIGSTEETQSFLLKETGINTVLLTFGNGIQDTFFHLNNSQGSLFYVDEVRVTQELQKGDKAYVMVDLNDAVPGTETSVDFKKLWFAPDAPQVYYDLYAVVREYNNPEKPDRYEQIYSEYSDKMVVNLSNPTGIVQTATETAHVFAAAHGIVIEMSVPGQVQVYNLAGQMQNTHSLSAGRHVLSVERGTYLVRIANKTYKINL